MRLPPVMSATLSVRFTEGRVGQVGLVSRVGKDVEIDRSGQVSVLTHQAYLPYLPCLERAEKRRPLVRVAPLRSQPRARERMLVRDADGRLIDGRERMEPLHRAA